MGGWLLDRLIGDPEGWPHPVVLFGKLISAGEKEFNKGENRMHKGMLFSGLLIVATYCICAGFLAIAARIHLQLEAVLIGVGVFYCLSGKTLMTEVQAVFEAVDRNVEEGRIRLSRIVGRDTSNLSPHEIKTAALESLAENLSDGVIAPLFWFALLGLPGMLAYKMINTLDSMIGYKTERYIEFGATAARIDDVANYVPARLTAYMMLFVSGNWNKRGFLHRFGTAHESPNAGYPEAALAAILDCRFGGTHDYFGRSVEKPYIGVNERPFNWHDLQRAIQVNNNTELTMGIIVVLVLLTGFPYLV
ncbi:adenosylcobinamide-phosphate synthase [Parabacteroides sp. PF5-5]|uniref:adenosylcobinamide-phosphate synthase CbiB n=1 Tax=unclassified Parabacteroides TaxID=2649774 RepID=UPI002475B417|nr:MULTISPECIES: adenosylcobinamide-phosphate synthase CbiB [unclassified Parabacteroides]MDH6305354.1 adenosylcobinamide-phosphate synthase [Parabacteroides sp. PH5-39]MDH6316707.1 adenosylcobinamide-phosphate synthase [Parabacteroides sp. PF5-13]MDH6320113.1 adenosylcobinamide-phosphate synthase [Parabacteroides sp. PH5-13]MDH6323944.1 adenosylcobinamide-phosphate synthase [Parabacteroides sp. PH5-8]MDH6327790.1 adenosylcobinamide-phosphate synthase [Parabacteroides sp. PH5-41]